MLKVDHSFKNLVSIKYDAVSVVDVNRSFGMPVVKSVQKNGRVVTEVVFECTPIEKMHEGLTVDDFALENLLANGYQPHRVNVDNQTLDTIDKGTQNIEKASKAIKSAKTKLAESNSNVEPKND